MMVVWHRLRGRAQLFNPVWHFGISEPVNHKCTHKSLQSRESDVFVGLQWSRRDFSDGLGIFEIDRLTIRIRKFSDPHSPCSHFIQTSVVPQLFSGATIDSTSTASAPLEILR